MNNSQSGLALQNLNLSGSIDTNNVDNDDDQANHQAKPAISNTRGGIKPLAPDSAEKPGRELGENEPQGDKPSKGRGGPTGDKKSRGTASLIAGASLPDVVSGKLSKGFDITNLEHLPAQREQVASTALPPPSATPIEEPVTHPVVTPPELRDTVKNYLIKLHHYDNQQQERKYGTDSLSNP